MAYDFNGANQYISSPITLPAITPVTLAAWCKPDGFTAVRSVLSVNNTESNGRHVLYLDTDAKLSAQTAYLIWAGQATTTATATVSTWAHCAGVFSSATSRTAYLNGSASTANTTNVALVAVDTATIGVTRVHPNWLTFFDGNIAEAAVWSAALDAAEIAALAKGVSPRLIRPQSLVMYAPLIRDPIDLKGAALTNNGATVATHPRIYP